MKLYDKYILPKAIDWACSQAPYFKQREKIIPLARGKVLEIGIGTGLNLKYYDPGKVKHVTGVDPSEAVWRKGQINAQSLPFEFEFIIASAEQLPFEDHHFDTIVTTYSMCTIPDLHTAFQEFQRVLRPNGSLLFCEHGIAPDLSVEKWQHRINPVWKKFSGGCNLNRDIPYLIEHNGFKIIQLETMYLPGWKPASYNYWGVARKTVLDTPPEGRHLSTDKAGSN
ncbi:MAG: class I SAM-dependent methyltransferase [Flavobacteriaceae bacterium]|nr:class I SAM-dependent methyltransferase [Flavobacteriaceae bacterium]